MKNFIKKLNIKLITSLAIVAVFSFSLTAFGAWTQPDNNPPTSNNIYAPINVGANTQEKVGSLIVGGLATPVFLLSSGSDLEGKVLTSDASGFGTWQSAGSGSVPSGNSGETLRHDGSGWVSNNFLYNDGSAIGIGTQSPGEQLEITGNILMPSTTSTPTGVIYKGSNAFLHDYGSNSVFLGSGAGNFTQTGTNNIGVGRRALESLVTGVNNVGVGTLALNLNQGGNNNVAIGREALESIRNGNSNIAIGYRAMDRANSGDNNTFLGARTGFAGSLNDAYLTAPGVDNSTALGADAEVSDSNQIRLGDDNVVTILGKVMFQAASDKRFKKNIKDLDLGLEFIQDLRPVSYQMKSDKHDKESFGFIAQEIEESLGDRDTMLIYTELTEEGMKYMRHTDLIAPLVKAVQEQQEEIEYLKKEIERLKANQ